MKGAKLMAGKPVVLVTNNPKALKVYENSDTVGVEFLENGTYLDVLTAVRDHVYAGWHLLSHPQASNLKPNQSPYKTVLISEKIKADEHHQDVEYIEYALHNYEKLTRGMIPPAWREKVLPDFMTIDLDVVESALNSSLLKQLIMSHR